MKDKAHLPVVFLYRGKETAQGTFGTLVYNGKTLCYTLEEPWRNNQPRVSCIPQGRYLCTPHNGARFKNVWILHDVPQRSAILIHAGNTLADTEGCILVGMRPSPNGVAESQVALNLLRQQLPKEFFLEVTRK